MSTRCQVKISHKMDNGTKDGWFQAVTLYHHCDGYPSYMLPTFWDAIQLVKKKDAAYKKKWGFGDHEWEIGRAGKAASYLCATDPGEYEPEDSHELHGDIEYYYEIELENKNGGSIDDTPVWHIRVTKIYGDEILGEFSMDMTTTKAQVKKMVAECEKKESGEDE